MSWKNWSTEAKVGVGIALADLVLSVALGVYVIVRSVW